MDKYRIEADGDNSFLIIAKDGSFVERKQTLDEAQKYVAALYAQEVN